MLDIEEIALRRARDQVSSRGMPVGGRDSWEIRDERRGKPGRRGSLADDSVRRIRKLIEEGVGQREIARRHGTSKGVVQGIKAGRIYRGVR